MRVRRGSFFESPERVSAWIDNLGPCRKCGFPFKQWSNHHISGEPNRAMSIRCRSCGFKVAHPARSRLTEMWVNAQ